MVFSSAVFLLVFLPIVFVSNLLVGFKTKISNHLLLIASLIFYAWGEPYLVLLMIASIFINWIVGIAISRTEGRSFRPIILAVGIIVNLSFLGYYKYAGFLARTLNTILVRDLLPLVDVALPIGISFFTFQAISYIVDVYRRDTEASESLVNVALYISFFPQLIAGPIVRYKDINKQIADRSVTWQGVSDGFKRFIYGLGKKVLIANTLGMSVDKVFDFEVNILDARTAWIGALAYTFQIYYDFSGYSDMAIGLGKMFGFIIPENFNYPYLSRSISEFWRRWHISLGTWFKEYVYILMGGNRKGVARTYFNLLLVFFLTGLWHGADMSFIIWGLYHGFFMLVERMGLKRGLDKLKVLPIIYSFFVVNLGWVLFRAENTMLGIKYMARILMPWRYLGSSIPMWRYLNHKTVFIFACAVLGAGIIQYLVPKKIRERWIGSIVEAIYCVLILLLGIASVASDTYNPFIYYQF